MKTSQAATAGYAGEESNHLHKMALAGLSVALSYVVFAFLQIRITLLGGDATPTHLGNAVRVLGALIMGGLCGGLGGAIGMTIGDPFDPVYAVYVPETFILRLCIGLIVGLVAHWIRKINETGDKKWTFRFVVVVSVYGLLFNVVFDPLVGYYYKLLISGKPAAQFTLAWNVIVPSISVVTSTTVAAAIYMPLRSVFKRAGLFERLQQGFCACQWTGMKQLP